MAHRFGHFRRMLLLALMELAAAGMPARASEPAGIVAVVSDIHVNPFAAPDLAPGLVGDKAHSMVFDVSKVTELVPDFRTTITFDEGARRILAYYDANPDAQRIDEGHEALFDRIAAHARSAG